MTIDPFDAYARLDPVRNDRPDWDEIGSLVVDAIDERAEPMTMQLTPPKSERPGEEHDEPSRRPKRLLLAAAAALVAIAVAAIVVATNTREEVPADQPPAPEPELDVIERTALATNLSEAERVWVGHYDASLLGELGPGDFELTFNVDGTFDTTATDQLCAMSGTWNVTTDSADLPTLRAQADCSGTTVAFESVGPRPEGLVGQVTTADGRSANFEAMYRPETIDRPLTAEEQTFVGDYAVRPCGPRGCSDAINELRADGTFLAQGSGENSFFSAPLEGHWEITDAGMLSAIGRSAGFDIRMWQQAYPDGTSEGQWSSNNGFGQAFTGTGDMIDGEPLD